MSGREITLPNMKIAFVGKGGSGKTTLSSLFIRYLAARHIPVTAVDADINQHLGVALGLAEEEAAALPALSARLSAIKRYLRGDNPRILSPESMIKTTPPGAGSRLLRLTEEDPVFGRCARRVEFEEGSARLLVTGGLAEEDLGVACYHAKTGAVELCLNHLVDGRHEYVVVDMTAGSDAFASGLFTRFDMTFLVAEPTRKGVSVYRQYQGHAREFGVALRVVGNKVQGPEDMAFLRAQAGADLLTVFPDSAWVRALERGRPRPWAELGAEAERALGELYAAADAAYAERDWERYTRQMVHFHLRNAASWGNERTGIDLAAQVDPGFVLGERTEGTAGTQARSGRAPSAQPA